MNNDDFYITLPSNTSYAKTGKVNTTSNFRVTLPQRIHLEGEWYVALSEIIYPYSWANIRDGDENVIKLLYLPLLKWVSIKIKPGHYATIESVLKAIQETIETESARLEFIIRSTVAAKLDNTEIANAKKAPDENEPTYRTLNITERLPTVSESVSFTLDEQTQRVRVLFNNKIVGNVELTASLQHMLGFKEKTIPQSTLAAYYPDMRAGFESLFIYCDIIEGQFVGDVQVPLLRIVNVTGNRLDIVDRSYDNPHYCRVLQKDIESIEISINNDFSQKILFEFGKVIVKLHFKKRSHF